MSIKNNSYKTGMLLGVLGVVLFSTKAILVKLAYRYEIDTLELLFFRMVFSLPFYLIILVVLHSENRKSINGHTTKKDFVWLFLFGFIGYYLASYFDFLGLNYIKAGLERIILFTYPTIVVLLSWFFFKQKLNKIQWMAITTSYIGIVITFASEISLSGDKTIWGGFLVLMSALTYAAYLVGSGWLIPKFGVLRFTCYAMIASTFCVVIHYSFVGDWKLFDFPERVYYYGLAMAIVSTLLPSFLVSEAIKRLGASSFSIIGGLGPVSTIILAYIFLGEQLGWIQLLGMAVVIIGISILSLKGEISKKA